MSKSNPAITKSPVKGVFEASVMDTQFNIDQLEVRKDGLPPPASLEATV
jgi:hypothetical protein